MAGPVSRRGFLKTTATGMVGAASLGPHVLDVFVRTSGPALALLPRGKRTSKHITVTGTVIWRSGAPQGGPFADKYQSAQLRFEGVEGLTCVGNTCMVGRDDGGVGQWTPDYGLVVRALTHSVGANNVLHEGALKELVADLGEHGEGVMLKENPGSLFKPAAEGESLKR